MDKYYKYVDLNSNQFRFKSKKPIYFNSFELVSKYIEFKFFYNLKETKIMIDLRESGDYDNILIAYEMLKAKFNER